MTSMMDLLDGVEITQTDMPPNHGDLTCAECGNAFDHVGRGRKPKNCPECREKLKAGTGTRRPASRRTTSKDVESALAVLDGVYSTMGLGLFVLSPNAAAQWNGSTDTLQAQNRVILAGDPNLCKSILRAGEKSGKAAFIIAHALALVPVVGILKDDWKASRANKPAKPKKQPQNTTPEPPKEPPYQVMQEPPNNTPGMSFFE